MKYPPVRTKLRFNVEHRSLPGDWLAAHRYEESIGLEKGIRKRVERRAVRLRVRVRMANHGDLGAPAADGSRCGFDASSVEDAPRLRTPEYVHDFAVRALREETQDSFDDWSPEGNVSG